MSGERQGKESGQNWEGSAGQTAQAESGKIQPKQLLILLVLSLSLAIIVIDATIVIVALPQIQKDFSISLKDLEWITSLYALIFGSFLLSWGKLSDEFGRKLIFMAGISTFIVGSIIDGFSQNLSQMLVGRVIQGFGAAMASPSTLSILTTTFTGKSRNVAFGIWGATAGAAAVLGPVLGGYFTTYISWRWAFFINIPIGIAALVGAALVIRETRFKDPKYTTDYPGLVFITSIFLQTVKGLSAISAGLTFLPMAISVFIFAPIAGVLATRFGPKWIITTGMVLEAAALFSMSQIISISNPVYYLYPVLVVYGAGVGLAISQVTSTVLMSIPWQKAGVGSGANNTVRQIGSAFGIAVIGAILVAQISTVGQAELAASTVNFGQTGIAILKAAFNSGLSGGIDPSLIASFGANWPAARDIIFDALTQGTRWAAFTAGIFVSLGALSSLLIPDPRPKKIKVAPKLIVQEPQAIGRTLGAIVISQFLTILGLSAALSSEYQSNPFMRDWFTSYAWPLGYLLGNYLGSMLIGIIGTILILWRLVR